MHSAATLLQSRLNTHSPKNMSQPLPTAGAEPLPMLEDSDDEDAPPPPHSKPPNALLSSFDDFGEPPPPPPVETDDFHIVGAKKSAASSSVSASSVHAADTSVSSSAASEDPFDAFAPSTDVSAVFNSSANRPASVSAAAAPRAAAISLSSPSASAAAAPTASPSALSPASPNDSVRSSPTPSPPTVSASAGPSASAAASSAATSPASSSLRTMSFSEDGAGAGAGPASSSHASMLTSAQDLGSAKSFASSLTHNFAGVSQQVEVGSYAAKRCASFLKKLAAAQEEYARSIQKLLAHEQAKFPKLSHDGMKGSTKTWAHLQDLFSRLAKSHLAESIEISQSVAAPLMDFHLSQEERRKEILVEERKSSLEMSKAREEVTKSLSQTLKLLEEARKLQTEAAAAEKAKAAAAASGGSGVGFFKTLSMKVGKKPEALIKDAAKAAGLYQTSILNANRRQARYCDVELPKLFNDMQLLEKRRMDTVRSRLGKFHASACSFVQERAGTMELIRATVEQIDPAADIATFIQDQLYEHGLPIPPRAFTYDLPCSVGDIEAGRLEGNPNSIFRSTLQHCMDLQKISSDQSAARLDLPRIVPTLISRIKELGGYTELGIFRISVGKDDLDALRKQIDTDGNYNLSNVKNAHICAALLKEWVRLLAEPLIPTETSYAAAIEAAKSIPAAAGAAGARDGVNTEAILKLFDNLPPLNQKVLRALSMMVRDLSTPANSEISKMTVDNLAIVFAPSFLRNPSEDPAVIMNNTKFETKFTANLFRIVGEITWD